MTFYAIKWRERVVNQYFNDINKKEKKGFLDSSRDNFDLPLVSILLCVLKSCLCVIKKHQIFQLIYKTASNIRHSYVFVSEATPNIVLRCILYRIIYVIVKMLSHN